LPQIKNATAGFKVSEIFHLYQISLAPVPTKRTRGRENINALLTSPENIEAAKKRKLVKEKETEE
jgi:hypothetical protein